MITQPNNSISTARELENLIDTYKGQVGLLESQMRENNKTLASQEYTIGQNILRNTELDTFIAKKEQDKINITNEIESLEKSKENISKDIKVLSTQRDEISEEKADLVQDVSGIMKERAEQSDDLTSREKEVSKRESAVNKKESTVNEKVELIKSFKLTI